MTILVIELIACLTAFLQIAAANDDAACASYVSTQRGISGQSMLQVKRHEMPPSGPQVLNSSRVVAAILDRAKTTSSFGHNTSLSVADSAIIMQTRRSHSKLHSLGSLATLDDKGYQTVADSCCQLEMELFIRRFIDGLGLEICDEDGLLSLLFQHSQCERERSDIVTLEGDVKKATAPKKCAFVAPPKSCPKGGMPRECLAGLKPAYHRRRQCNARVQRNSDPEVPTGAGECKLPHGAVWCEVRLTNLPAFWMAVYDWDVGEDWVSHNLCEAGYWEEKNIALFGSPGHMLDIGGNIGYFTLAFAQAGWKVTTFEPMANNLELIRASLCRNPQLAARVHVNWFGLGTTSKVCRMMVPKDNIGDGFANCKSDNREQKTSEFVDRGPLNIRRLDEVLLEQGISRVDLVKIDVEGYEAQVFAGAPDFLDQYRPRLIKSEVWSGMVGNITGVDYLDKFKSAGYKVFKDTKCKIPIENTQAELDKGSIDVVMCLE
jgi:FkbM family methyltransferase